MLFKKSSFAILVLLIFCFSSCYSTKDKIYFSGLKDTTFVNFSNSIPIPRIQRFDLLSISVSSLSEEASTLFNKPNANGIITTTTAGMSNGTETNGYLVNAEGQVDLPLIGNISALNKTRIELQEEIKNLLVSRKLLLDPIVNIRFLSFKVTVIGDVFKPSVFNVPTEKITLLEAIGLAGDLNITGKRENVLLIREENDKRIVRHINLNSQELFTSDYYYLKPNDVIYVEPNKDRVATSSRSLTWIPAITSTISLLIIYITYLKR